MVALILLRECYFYEWIETFFTAPAEIIFDMERDAIYTRLDIMA